MTDDPCPSPLLLAAAVVAAVWPAVCSLLMETQYILRVTCRAIHTTVLYVLVPGRAAVSTEAKYIYQGTWYEQTPIMIVLPTDGRPPPPLLVHNNADRKYNDSCSTTGKSGTSELSPYWLSS